MAFESTRNLLSSLIQQQRETELMQQTPQFQAAVDQLFANRVQFAQNQVVMDKLGRAQNNDEVWEALKTVKPEDYVKRKREQLVGGQILDLLKKSPEQERDYGLINYLASSIGYDDVGPIERRPMSEESFDQQLRLRKSAYGDRNLPASTRLRAQRESKFLDWLKQGILFGGEPATQDKIDELENTYIRTGDTPEGYSFVPTEPKQLTPTRIPESQRGMRMDAIKDELSKDEWFKKNAKKFEWKFAREIDELYNSSEFDDAPEVVKNRVNEYIALRDYQDIRQSLEHRGQIPSLPGEQELQQRSEQEITEATSWLSERNIPVTPKNIESYFTKYKK